MAAPREIVPFPAPMVAVSAVRGTLLGSSLQAMRERGLEREYFSTLPLSFHDEIRSLVAMTWLPLGVAVAHYRVMGQLITNPADQRAIGQRVGDRVQKSYLATVIRTLRVAGLVAPRMLLVRMPTIWSRLFTGGGVRLIELDVNDVAVEAHCCALFDEPYFCRGWEGVWESSLRLVDPAVRVLPGASPEAGAYGMRVTRGAV